MVPMKHSRDMYVCVFVCCGFIESQEREESSNWKPNLEEKEGKKMKKKQSLKDM